jgi:hypothetical protein
MIRFVAAIGTQLRNTLARWVARLTMISIGPLGATSGAQTNCPGLSLVTVSSGEAPIRGTCCAKATPGSARAHPKVARNLLIRRGELSPARAGGNYAKGVDGNARRMVFADIQVEQAIRTASQGPRRPRYPANCGSARCSPLRRAAGRSAASKPPTCRMSPGASSRPGPNPIGPRPPPTG